MKPLAISDASSVILVLQDEIRRSRESRYDHRLHGVLLWPSTPAEWQVRVSPENNPYLLRDVVVERPN